MERFLTLLVSNDNEEPKPVEERKLFDNREEGLEHGLHVSLQCLPVVYTADTSVV